MTNVIEGLAKRIDNVPVELLDDAIRAFVVIAERNGGKMMGGSYQLTAKVAKRYQRPGVAYAWMKGVPSGFWQWKETGTQAHVIAPRKKSARSTQGLEAGAARPARPSRLGPGAASRHVRGTQVDEDGQRGRHGDRLDRAALCR